MPTPDCNLAWCRALVDALVEAGVGHFCVSPGSRSAPIALAVAERAGASNTVHLDERSAAYFAVGYGQATGRPAALVCTSGTAAANYLPALVEAHYSRVPLVALTADRPPELRDVGAWQTIDQRGLFGTYVRWFVDLALPEAGPAAIGYVRNVAARAAKVAAGRPPGPVHLNVPLREPLVPWQLGELRPGSRAGMPPHAEPPCLDVPRPWWRLPQAALAELAARLAAEPKGLVVAGRMLAEPLAPQAVARLAKKLGYPVLAEPASQLRFGAHDRSHVVAHYDVLLRSQAWAQVHRPRLVMRFGATPTWKNAAGFLATSPDCYQVAVDPEATWDDPYRHARLRLPADIVPLCRDLEEALDRPGTQWAGRPGTTEDSAWLRDWLAADRRAEQCLADLLGAPEAAASAAWVHRTVAEALPDGALVYLANSMAVRDFDTFAGSSAARAGVLVNRGAAGIDGTVSSALGAAFGSGQPTVLLSGDLALAHDLGGLAAAGTPGVRLTVVAVDDGGGGIFDYLPVAGTRPELFERFFRTPAEVDLGIVCRAFGVPFEVAAQPGALRQAMQAAAEAGTRVVQVPVNHRANAALHRRYWSAVDAALSGPLPKLYVETQAGGSDSGLPLVLLHGFTGDSTTWSRLRPHLPAGRRVLAVDLVGHGQSEAPHEPAAYTMPVAAAALEQALAALRVPRAHFVGYSMGGRVALWLALERPDLAASLTLVGASPGVLDPVQRAARLAADLALAGDIESEGLEAFVDRWSALPLFASQAALGPDYLAQARSQRLRNRPHALALTLCGMGKGAMTPLWDRLGELQVPVLAVAGSLDGGACQDVRAMVHELPDARPLVIPGAGHAVHVEAPAALGAAMIAFLAELDLREGRPGGRTHDSGP